MSIYRSTDPSVYDDVDGIVINESAPAPSISGVAANIAILVGQFQRGPTALTEVGSIGDFHEQYGKSSFEGNKQLKNKKFGRLRCIRVVASDGDTAEKAFASESTDRITFAAKQGVGAYGNNIQVKIENSANDVQQQYLINFVADVAGSLDGKYFLLADKDGTVAFWFDHGDSGTSEPAHGANRSVEITTVTNGDGSDVVATKCAAVIAADSQFEQVSISTNELTVKDIDGGTRTGYGAGDSSCSVTSAVDGVEGGKKYTIKDNNTYAVLPEETYDVKIGDIDDSTFGESKLITATVNSTADEPDSCAFTSLAGGADGTVADTDYETAIAEAEIERAGNVIFLDEYTANRRTYLKTHVAGTKDKMCILAGDDDTQTKAQVISDVGTYRDSDGRIIYAFNAPETVIDGNTVYTCPASWYASVFSQTSPHIDPAYAANTEFMAGMTGLKWNLSRADYIELKDAGVSAFEYDDDIGFKIKSGVVTQIADSSKVMVFRRRMSDYLTNSVGVYLKNYQNAPNTIENRREVKSSILAFIQGQETDGILPKDSEVTTGVSKLVDTESLNTDTTIAQGFFKILWKQRIHSSMRFIVLIAEIGESVVVTEQEA